MLKIVLVLFLLLAGYGYSEQNQAEHIVEQNLSEQESQIVNLKSEVFAIDNLLEKNIWITRYTNYLTYRKIEKELTKMRKDAKKYGSWKGEKYKELAYQLYNKIRIKENELELISEYKDSPIGKQITPAPIDNVPEVTNPIAIIEALSFVQQLNENVASYKKINSELEVVLEKLESKKELLKEISKLEKSKEIKSELEVLDKEINDFRRVLDIVSTTDEVYSKKVIQVTQEIQSSITEEGWRTARLALIIFILFALSLGVKKALKEYLDDDDKHYTTNKFINFVFIGLVVLIILFSYIDNVSYLVTILGFASAGIAIALKDWFMSIFGWMAIMTSGAISVGDRIKVTRDGVEVVGDVLDISLFKIAVREDITLTTYMVNRRAGRVFFIPNNYIFTDMISNYTFDQLRTVWDGIDICITFDSNHQRAVELAKTITQTHAKGYTDLTKKRLQKMRKKYILRSASPEPRVFSLMEPYGIVISSWYYTNSHATLALRSTISMELLEAFKAADDITIAYPTQTLRVANHNMHPDMLLPGNTTGLFDAPPSP